MQKKMLAVAVAGALGAPAVAMAQTSTVQIFGTFYVEYESMHQGRGLLPTAAGVFNDRQTVDMYQTPGSEIGFKGEEKLGGGLSAWFQCISTIAFNASTTGAGSELCTRNSALGLKGGWGNLFVGRWDMPFKRTIGPGEVGAQDTGLWGAGFLLTGGSTSTLETTSRATFRRRQGNSMFYDSPNFGGFQVMAGFSSPQGSGAAGVGTAATTGVTSSKPRVLSLGGQYSAGPLYVSAGYERHNQFSPVGGQLDDRGWHLTATYRWGPVLFGGAYTRQKFEMTGATSAAPTTLTAAGGAPATTAFGNLAGGASTAEFPAFTLGVDWQIAGPHGLRASYTRAQDARGNTTQLAGPAVGGFFPATNTILAGTYRPTPCVGYGATAAAATAAATCGGTGANLWTVRYVYNFSKRTEINVGAAWLHNDSNASYSLGGLTTPQVGTRQYGYGVSMRHTF